MEADYILRQEHEEFVRRIDDENDRQNHRLTALEESSKEIHSLGVSMERMAANMENMLAEQRKLGDRMEVLEKEPADAYRQIKMVVITAIVSAVITAAVGAVMVLL